MPLVPQWITWLTLISQVMTTRLGPSSASDSLWIGDFCDQLTTSDVVAEATILRVEPDVRHDIRGLGPVKLTDITVHVDAVLLGVVERNELVVSSGLSWGDELRPGAEAVIWAFRSPWDGWRLRGNVAVLTPAGIKLHHSIHDVAIRGYPRDKPFTLAALRECVHSRSTQNAGTMLEGKTAVALVRITGATSRGNSAREWEYTCDGLEWAYGSGASMPRSFLARDVPGTRHDVEIGDTLALPVPATGSPPGWLRLQGYIIPLIVQGGFVPALGVRLNSLKSALKETAEGTRLRRILQEE